MIKTDIAIEVWRKKYQYDGEEKIETFMRAARELASVEQEPNYWYPIFLKTLLRFNDTVKIDQKGYPTEEPQGLKATLGGRILANIGTSFAGATLMNCFIDGPVADALISYHRKSDDGSIKYKVDIQTSDSPDDLSNIFLTILEQAKTLASEGGYGINFGFIRPRGAVIKGIGIRHPGVISYMKLWDAVSDCMVKGDDDGYTDKLKNYITEEELKLISGIVKSMTRKGAMMGCLPVWHPDIEEFIRAKQTSGVLTKFNMSVVIDDEFMNAVINDEMYELTFDDKVYKRVKARELYDLIMEMTYNRAEPGVLFVDNMHRNNPIAYLGKCDATNPCIIGSSIIGVADGRNGISIKQLAIEGKDVPVYSKNKDGQVEIKMGRNPRKTGKKQEVWKLVLDDGSEFIATPDHKMKMSNGDEIELQKLKPNDSLSPFYSYENKKYRQISQSSKRRKQGGLCLSRRQYRLIYEFYFPEEHIDSKLHRIHHKDNNPKNDVPNNLKKMTIDEHNESHDISGENNPMYNFPTKIKDPEAYHKNMSTATSGLRNGRAIQITDEYFNTIVTIIKDKKRRLEKREIFKELQARNLPVITRFRMKELECSSFSEVMDKAESCAFVNHKVKSISFYGYEDVYNITVDDNHNYAVVTSTDDDKYITSSGIFVKNCGEIPGTGNISTVCLLGSMNLTQYIYIDEQGIPQFDFEAYKSDIVIFTRMLDNVNDLTKLPLPAYEEVVRLLRQFGMGINGLGSALMMLQVPYNADTALDFAKKICELKENITWQTSAKLAKEKGAFPGYDAAKFTNTEYYKSDRLWPETKELIEKYGVRNAKTTTNPPLGNTSVFCDNVSNGLEPVFSLEYERKIMCNWPEGLTGDNIKTALKHYRENDYEYWRGDYEGKTYYYEPHNRGLCEVNIVRDYGYQWLLDNFPDKDHSSYLTTTRDLSIQSHLEMQKIVQYYCNQSVSKTCNLPNDYPFEDFKQLYINAWKYNLNGFTVYRDGCMESVISSIEHAQQNKQIIEKDIKLPEVFINGPTHIIKREGLKFYLHFSYLPEDVNMTFPFCLWIYSNAKEEGQTKICNKASRKLAKFALEKGIAREIVQDCIMKAKQDYSYNRLGRMISLCLRHNIQRVDILTALRGIEGDNISTLLTAIRKFISLTIEDGTKVEGIKCENEECVGDRTNVVLESGCTKCLDCGWSGCN